MFCYGTVRLKQENYGLEILNKVFLEFKIQFPVINF